MGFLGPKSFCFLPSFRAACRYPVTMLIMQRCLLSVLWKTHKQVTAIKPNSLHWVFSITTPLSLSGVSGFCFFASHAQHFSKMYIKYAQSHQPSTFNLFNMASATYPPPTKKLALSRFNLTIFHGSQLDLSAASDTVKASLPLFSWLMSMISPHSYISSQTTWYYHEVSSLFVWSLNVSILLEFIEHHIHPTSLDTIT